MDVAIPNKLRGGVIGASVFASVPAERFYEAVRDVRGFPRWAPGVRRVEVIRGLGEPGMLSEWEVSFLGLRKKVWSVLEEAEPPAFLRWTYDGPVKGWGECEITSGGGWTLAEFRTELDPRETYLRWLMRSAPVEEAAHGHLRRSLARLGELVTGDGGRFVVGPPGRSSRQREGRELREIPGSIPPIHPPERQKKGGAGAPPSRGRFLAGSTRSSRRPW